jgi:hypothetical protein
MRQAFVQQAVLRMAADVDEGAPGASVTVELCGHWEHDGACRWPHHTAVVAGGDGLTVRTVFACEPADEAVVRDRIVAGLSAGGEGMEAVGGSWTVIETAPDSVLEQEQALAARLAFGS